MNKRDLIERNKKFTLAVIRTCEGLPSSISSNVIARQLIRCSTSIGANYRAACRAKSSADFINKLKIVEEETDESIYFLDLLKDLNANNNFDSLIKEANELLSIFVSSINTARKNTLNRKSENRNS